MRETFKSLSVFSATLIVLLFVSTGCVVNIPGCGKRSLPFFQKVERPVPPPPPPSTPVEPPAPVEPAAAAAPSPPAPGTEGAEIPVDDVEPTATPTTGPPPTATPTPTPTPWNVERMAYTVHEKEGSKLWTMNVDGTVRIPHTPDGRVALLPHWSPDGKTLAFLSDLTDGHLNIHLLEKGEHVPRAVTFDQGFEVPDPGYRKPPYTWSPRSDQLAYLFQGQVWLWDRQKASPQVLAAPHPNFRAVEVEWAPRRENRYVAYLVQTGRGSAELWLANPRIHDQLLLARVEQGTPGPLTWHPNTDSVAFRATLHRIETADVNGLGSKPLFESLDHDFGPVLRYTPVESSQPQLLLLARPTGEEAWRVAVLTPGEKPTLTLHEHTAGATDAVWSPDGKRVAYTASGNLFLMNPDGTQKTRLTVEGVMALDWSRK